MSGKIFISYRRQEDFGNAGRLFDRLKRAFTAERVFMDVDNIRSGDDFEQIIEEEVARCDVLLAVIGKGWIEQKDEQGVRKLDSPSDFVRLELEAALRQEKRITPVLMHDGRFPRADELPELIRSLARRHYVQLRHDRYEDDVEKLITDLRMGLEKIAAAREVEAKYARLAQESERRHEPPPQAPAVAAQTHYDSQRSEPATAVPQGFVSPAPAAAAKPAPAPGRPKPLLRVLVVAAVLVVGAGIVWRINPTPTPVIEKKTDTPKQAPAPAPKEEAKKDAPKDAPKAAATGECPTLSQGSYSELQLKAGFMPDPHKRKITAGGDLSLAGCRDFMTGWVSRKPDLALRYEGSGNLTLTFEVVSEADTVLVINDPGAAWHFDDDSAGGHNPRIRFPQAKPGRYDIWVGTYEQGKNGANSELTITEK